MKIKVGAEPGSRRIPWFIGLVLAPALVVWMFVIMLVTFVVGGFGILLGGVTGRLTYKD